VLSDAGSVTPIARLNLVPTGRLIAVTIGGKWVGAPRQQARAFRAMQICIDSTGANEMTTSTASSFQQYASAGERTVARKLVRAILAAGYSISVNDGMKWTVKNATRCYPVLDALCTTGEDTLRLCDHNDDPVASFYLIWGNEENGECLISDFTANDLCEGLWKQALGDLA